jgi:UDP-glucose:(heptosyl)LPS alpha-1,3-glucosyltransferase
MNMRFAFVLFKYFPFGGLQRDFSRIAEALIDLGHEVDAYCIIWDGPMPKNINVNIAPIKAFSNHQRNARFATWLTKAFQEQHYDAVVGFNKISGLDVYYAADPCYQDKALTLRHPLYRLGSRYKQFYKQEQSVFSTKSTTEILMISEVQKPLFQKHYHTPEARFHLLPPGISEDRKAPKNSADIRSKFRKEWNIEDNQQLMLMVGSGFRTKGLDRALLALASLPEKQKASTRFIVIGQDNPKKFQTQAKSLGIEDNVTILKGRNDIPHFLLGADLLIHPAYNENTGTILLEAVVAGLPVLVTDVCGYAHYIEEADVGTVLNSPFSQLALNNALTKMLSTEKTQWQQNALSFAAKADIYSMPVRAAQIIEATALKKQSRKT